MLISLSDIQSKSNCHKNERLEIGVLEETLLSTEWFARGFFFWVKLGIDWAKFRTLNWQTSRYSIARAFLISEHYR